MSFAIAAAGTGGHVYPGLAVGDALVSLGVAREDVLFIGGRRLEATVYPKAGFPFLAVPLQGLQRRLSPANLTIPMVLARAARRIGDELSRRGVAVLLGMGGYVTVPSVWAARRLRIPVMIAEQNAEAGLANRLVYRMAESVFGSFPQTKGLPTARWVGNPIRFSLATFDREKLRASDRYRLDPDRTTVGIFGGSLGASVLNVAAERMVASWSGGPAQFLHLAGAAHAAAFAARATTSVPGGGPVPSTSTPWVVLGFEEHIEHFFAACDLVVARAGGSVAEIIATATPAVLVPGRFGSGRHQQANAAVLAAAGAAVLAPEEEIGALGSVVAGLCADPGRRAEMAAATGRLARPSAAYDIALALRGRHG